MRRSTSTRVDSARNVMTLPAQTIGVERLRRRPRRAGPARRGRRPASVPPGVLPLRLRDQHRVAVHSDHRVPRRGEEAADPAGARSPRPAPVSRAAAWRRPAVPRRPGPARRPRGRGNAGCRRRSAPGSPAVIRVHLLGSVMRGSCPPVHASPGGSAGCSAGSSARQRAHRAGGGRGALEAHGHPAQPPAPHPAGAVLGVADVLPGPPARLRRRPAAPAPRGRPERVVGVVSRVPVRRPRRTGRPARRRTGRRRRRRAAAARRTVPASASSRRAVAAICRGSSVGCGRVCERVRVVKS